MQFNIFNAIAESNINELISLLNDGLKPNEQYKLVSADDLPNDLILLTVSNGYDYLLNIVNQVGKVPKDRCVNWSTSSIIIREFGEEIPKCLVRIRVSEINKDLLNKGYNWDDIEKFWDDIFKKNKK